MVTHRQTRRGEQLRRVVKDVRCLVRIFRAVQHRAGNMIVLGHSLGAISLLAWVHDYALPVRASDSGHRSASSETLRAVVQSDFAC